MKKTSNRSRQPYVLYFLHGNIFRCRKITFISMLLLTSISLFAHHPGIKLREVESIGITFSGGPGLTIYVKLYDVNQTSEEWTLDKTIQNVDVYHRIIICNGSAAVMLKFYNKKYSACKNILE